VVRLGPLDRKLARDLWQTRGQALAIALVIAAGITLFIVMRSTLDSLDLTQRTYYERYRFAHVFASLKRAPMALLPEIEAIPGVAQVETRVVVNVLLDVPDLPEPAVGRLISVPEVGRPAINDVFLRSGRWLEPGRPDEVMVSENFALANGLRPGDSLAAVINGRRRELRIVGLGLTPEFIYTVRPGEIIPDDTRFGVIWMERRALANAFQMEGGFNDVVMTLMPGASEPEVIARLDRALEAYGGLGAYPRERQLSHWYLDNELEQLRGTGLVIPVVFLAVAAFLLNVVLTRIVSVQREQIAAMKALGRTDRELGIHYLKWALAIAVVGALVGTIAGAWLGLGMTRIYTEFFHFPILQYRLSPAVVVQGLLVALAAATAGAWIAARRALKLPPAEAMRPEPPAAYRESLIERAGFKRWLSQPGRMIFRSLQRHPGRVAVTILGIALGGALMVVGSFSLDSVNLILDAQFSVSQRHNVMVTFVEPRSGSAIHDLARYPGVFQVEPFRAVPVRLSAGHRSRQTSITGLPAEPMLQRVIDADLRPLSLPTGGLMLSAKLAELLEASVGDVLRAEVLDGRRPVHDVPVAAVVEEFMGTAAYMELETLNRLMREGDSVSGAYLLADEGRMDELYRRLKDTPVVAGVALKRATLDNFNKTFAESVAITRTLNVLFSTIIAFGVVYNAARISLAERSRELATLRVIGFSRAEISYILLGELAVVTIVAIPLGLVVGRLMAGGVVQAMGDTELFRMPLVISSRTYAFSAITILVATAFSSLGVRRKLDRLDLVEVLKTRE
jgi:putative ABC transport system permease protein